MPPKIYCENIMLITFLIFLVKKKEWRIFSPIFKRGKGTQKAKGQKIIIIVRQRVLKGLIKLKRETEHLWVCARGVGKSRKRMGTREVYEEKLRSGNMYHHDPTINPGLGSPRCPRCLSLLNPNSVTILSPFSFTMHTTCLINLLFHNTTTLWLMMIQAGGEWTITSVLHDATVVVSFFSASFIFHNTLIAAYVEFWIEFHYINCFFRSMLI